MSGRLAIAIERAIVGSGWQPGSELALVVEGPGAEQIAGRIDLLLHSPAVRQVAP